MNAQLNVDHASLALINDLLDGSISSVDADRLERRLMVEPRLRRAYVQLAAIHARLAISARRAPLSSHAEPKAPMPRSKKPRSAGRISIAAWSIAAVLLLATTIGLVVMIASARSDRMAPESPSLPPVAVFTDSADVQWLDKPISTGDGVAPRRLAMSRGLMELAFHGGATVRVTDASSFDVMGPREARLHHGRLWSRITTPSGSLRVHGPNFTVVDLGTEFGVEVGPDGSGQVHVFDGSVRLTINGRLDRTMKAGESVEIAVDGSFREQAIVAGARERLMGLPAGLVHHWTFDDGTARDVVGDAHGILENGATVIHGRLVLDGVDDYLHTRPTGREIGERTLVAQLAMDNLEQQSAGVLVIENPEGRGEDDLDDVFDGIVFGESGPGIWMNGSDWGVRGNAVNVSSPRETRVAPATVVVAITYRSNGAIAIYREGEQINSVESVELMRYPAGRSRFLMGLRHSDRLTVPNPDEVPGVRSFDPFLAGAIDQALVFDRALDSREIARLTELIHQTSDTE